MVPGIPVQYANDLIVRANGDLNMALEEHFTRCFVGDSRLLPSAPAASGASSSSALEPLGKRKAPSEAEQQQPPPKIPKSEAPPIQSPFAAHSIVPQVLLPSALPAFFSSGSAGADGSIFVGSLDYNLSDPIPATANLSLQIRTTGYGRNLKNELAFVDTSRVPHTIIEHFPPRSPSTTLQRSLLHLACHNVVSFSVTIIRAAPYAQVRIDVSLLPRLFSGTLPDDFSFAHVGTLVNHFMMNSALDDPAHYYHYRHGHAPAVASDSLFSLYEAIRPPADAPMAPQPPSLRPILRGYQRRCLHWMLARETNPGQVNAAVPGLHPAWIEVQPPGPSSPVLYYNLVSGRLSKTVPTDTDRTRGGILADEMGLGKTIEVMALILSHTMPLPPGARAGEPQVDESGILTSGTTLIITPQSICHQWESEFRTHAPPSLSVLIYDGVKQGKVDPRTMAGYDVVLTTYEALKTEIRYAESFTGRSLRHPKKYTYEKTPLLRINFWRVCLDEAQMVETTTSAAAEMALKIQTVNRWCVTGTPVKSSLDDLYGLVLFLQHDPFSDRHWWKQAFLNTPHQPSARTRLCTFLRSIFWRHTKAQVNDEINLPPQTICTVKVQLSPVEHSNYQRLEEVCVQQVQRILASLEKASKDDEEEMGEGSSVHNLVLRLRQAAIHPQLGAYGVGGGSGSSAASSSGGAALESMQNVLQTMIRTARQEQEQSSRDYMRAVVPYSALLAMQPSASTAEEKMKSLKEAVDVLQEGLKVLEPALASLEQELAVTERKAEAKLKLQEAKSASGVRENAAPYEDYHPMLPSEHIDKKGEELDEHVEEHTGSAPSKRRKKAKDALRVVDVTWLPSDLSLHDIETLPANALNDISSFVRLWQKIQFSALYFLHDSLVQMGGPGGEDAAKAQERLLAVQSKVLANANDKVEEAQIALAESQSKFDYDAQADGCLSRLKHEMKAHEPYWKSHIHGADDKIFDDEKVRDLQALDIGSSRSGRAALRRQRREEADDEHMMVDEDALADLSEADRAAILGIGIRGGGGSSSGSGVPEPEQHERIDKETLAKIAAANALPVFPPHHIPELYGPDRKDLREAQQKRSQGDSRMRDKRFAEASACYERACEMLEACPGTPREILASCYVDIAWALVREIDSQEHKLRNLSSSARSAALFTAKMAEFKRDQPVHSAKAVTACNKAQSMDPKNVNAIFVRELALSFDQVPKKKEFPEVVEGLEEAASVSHHSQTAAKGDAPPPPLCPLIFGFVPGFSASTHELITHVYDIFTTRKSLHAELKGKLATAGGNPHLAAQAYSSTVGLFSLSPGDYQRKLRHVSDASLELERHLLSVVSSFNEFCQRIVTKGFNVPSVETIQELVKQQVSTALGHCRSAQFTVQALQKEALTLKLNEKLATVMSLRSRVLREISGALGGAVGGVERAKKALDLIDDWKASLDASNELMANIREPKLPKLPTIDIPRLQESMNAVHKNLQLFEGRDSHRITSLLFVSRKESFSFECVASLVHLAHLRKSAIQSLKSNGMPQGVEGLDTFATLNLACADILEESRESIAKAEQASQEVKRWAQESKKKDAKDSDHLFRVLELPEVDVEAPFYEIASAFVSKGFVPLGTDPKSILDDLSWVKRERNQMMRVVEVREGFKLAMGELKSDTLDFKDKWAEKLAAEGDEGAEGIAEFEAAIARFSKEKTELGKVMISKKGRLEYLGNLAAKEEAASAPQAPQAPPTSGTSSQPPQTDHQSKPKGEQSGGPAGNTEKAPAVSGSGSGSGSGQQEEDATMCPICFEEDFAVGVITTCGHVFCRGCMLEAKEKIHPKADHVTCPVCRNPLPLDSLVEFSAVKPVAPKLYVGSGSDVATEGPHLDPSIRLMGSYGSKVDAVVRHILYLRKKEPATKSLVFSQWKPVLDLVCTALDQNGIGYITLQGKANQINAVRLFNETNETRVFILNSKSQSSGLTLVRASHVFMLEPVLNPAIELQAINRVHRIGQTKPTFVHKYIMHGTIEERVEQLIKKASTGASDTAALKKEEKETLRLEQIKFLFGIDA